jgi:CheY-like chemotaxis protein
MHRDPECRFASVDEVAAALLPMASAQTRPRWSADFVAPRASPELIDRSTNRGRKSMPVERTLVDEPSHDEGSASPTPVLATRASLVPATRSSPPASNSLSSSLPPPERDKLRPSVLVVDDDDLNLRTFRRAFRGDFEITCADSGARALECLASLSFDVALVDYAMPGMNGVEFLRAARTLYPDLRAVMVTAHADLPEVKAALSNGWVQAIIMKPFDREGILRWVSHCHRIGSMRKSVGAMRMNVGESGRG